jgi:ring-1,2-phenylacetyl-CoA epoxidase subunit PaaB
MDTQLPRFQVFVQSRPGEPHLDAGSVHAPDAEMALLNARDVFVRRPECCSLWIVPAQVIYSRTRQELERQAAVERTAEEDKPGLTEPYAVFCKTKSAGTQTYTGEVQASSAAEALHIALQQFSRLPAPFTWWVIPVQAIVQSNPDDIPSLFTPALDKPFRLSTDFHTLTAMRAIKDRRQPPESDKDLPAEASKPST